MTDDIDAGALIHHNPLNRRSNCPPALRKGHILPYKQAIVRFLCSIVRISLFIKILIIMMSVASRDNFIMRLMYFLTHAQTVCTRPYFFVSPRLPARQKRGTGDEAKFLVAAVS